MNTVWDHNPNRFLERTREFLEAEEATNLLALGIIFRLASAANAPSNGNEPLLLLVEEGAQICAVCIAAPPRRLILSCRDDAGSSLIGSVCRYLVENHVQVPGAVGPANATARFAAAWTDSVGCRTAVSMRQMIHRIASVNEISAAPGRLILADSKHEGLVAHWLQDFARVAPEDMTRQQALLAARAAISESRVYLWTCNEPVSMAAWTRPTRHGVAVTWVYTPPHCREKGYATSAVAALTRLLLQKGYEFCTLYTDLANPISNSIYRRIGYVPIQESVVYDFS